MTPPSVNVDEGRKLKIDLEVVAWSDMSVSSGTVWVKANYINNVSARVTNSN